jgi:hypothetical protein
MDPLYIEATEDSPKVVLDDQNQVYLFEGESRPQHTYKFYKPIIDWLDEYANILFWQKEQFGKARSMTFQFKLSYFNSTSAKFLGDVLSRLDKLCQDGFEVQVKWYYDTEDSDMKESGEEYQKMMKKLPMKMILIGGPEDKK